jgi:acetyl esterase
MTRRVFHVIAPVLGFLALGACGTRGAGERNPRAAHETEAELGVEWAAPGGRALYMDIYRPLTGRPPYPVILIFHGGGWLVNDRRIMSDAAAYLAAHGEYLVCNADYRLLGDAGNTTTMPEIIGDCLGALAWVKANASARGGAPERIALSGDSSGGHLAAMVAMASGRLGRGSYGPPSFSYAPSWWPEGRDLGGFDLSVKAVVCHFPVTDLYALCARGGYEGPGNAFWAIARKSPRGLFGPGIDPSSSPEYYRASSPLHLIPQAAERVLPPVYCAVGSADSLVRPDGVKEFVEALRSAGQEAEYWEYPGKGHAYLDSGSNVFLGNVFRRDAPPALDRMLDFLDRVMARP